MVGGSTLKNRHWTMAMLLAVLVMLCTTAVGKTIRVGGDDQADFTRIQAAIDAAHHGDTVLVAPGEYVITEPISFLGKAIMVQSEVGPEETVIRMGTPVDPDNASVVAFENQETEASMLVGFTITQGKGRWDAATSDRNGGGILFYRSSGVVKDCIVVANSATRGGGILFQSSSGVAKNCTVVANSATRGGGVMVNFFSNPLLTNCIVSGNLATSPGDRIDGYGGGLLCSDHSQATLTNCTVWGNTALQGGGANCLPGGGLLVTNSILWGNTAIQGNEIYLEQAATALSVAYSNVAGGQAGIYAQGEGWFDWAAGNTDVEPMFASPGCWADLNDPNLIVEPNDPNAVWIGGDYHLKSAAGRWDPNSESWVVDDVTSPCIDAGDPNSLVGDEPAPNGGRTNMGAYGGTVEASLSSPDVYLQWLGHASVKIWTDDTVVYVDPRNLSASPHDATLVLVTHTHGDHYQRADIGKVSGPETVFIAPPDVVQQHGEGEPMAPGQTIDLAGVPVTGVAAYNPNKDFHPKARNWVGFVVELGSKRIYVAGDTDLTDEMKVLEDIDVAILPAGGVYTMNAAEAAQATGHINPQLAIPYHWGDIVGTLADAQQFAALAQCPVKIMTVGETISLND